jgi:hypothetical protein
VIKPNVPLNSRTYLQESFSEEKVNSDKNKSQYQKRIFKKAVNESLSVEVEKLCSFIRMVLSKFCQTKNANHLGK